MNETLETSICWGSLLVGAIVCLLVMGLLMQEVRKGRSGRFRATIIQGVAIPFLGLVPVVIAMGVRGLANFAGVALFTRDGGNDGRLVGVGILGMMIALGAAILFAVVMLFQALTASGRSEDVINE